jgi:archaetidylinositol phosphate synthase
MMTLTCSIITALFFAIGRPLEAAFMILLTGFFDIVDGGVARITRSVSGFGATLDALVDRYTEFFQVIGIVLGGYRVDWWLGMCTAFTMNASSYVRARAESTGGMKDCSVGIIERPEKLLLLATAAILYLWFERSIEYTLWLLLILGQFTILQRLHANWKHSRNLAAEENRKTEPSIIQ